MTAALRSVWTERPPPAAAVLLDLDPGTELLTVTAHPVAPGAVVIVVHGEVDLCTSRLLQEGLFAHLHHTTSQMIVDFTGVGFFEATGLTVLVTVRQAAVAAGIRLYVVADTRPVLLPLTITGLDRVFDIYPDPAHALRRPAGGPHG